MPKVVNAPNGVVHADAGSDAAEGNDRAPLNCATLPTEITWKKKAKAPSISWDDLQFNGDPHEFAISPAGPNPSDEQVQLQIQSALGSTFAFGDSVKVTVKSHSPSGSGTRYRISLRADDEHHAMVVNTFDTFMLEGELTVRQLDGAVLEIDLTGIDKRSRSIQQGRTARWGGDEWIATFKVRIHGTSACVR